MGLPDGETALEAEDSAHAGSSALKELEENDSPALIGGMQVTFQEVNYQVPNRANKSQKLTILNRVSGYFSSAQLAAIMGPSGSGKSTLLDVLSGRKTVGEIKGEILFAGKAPSRPFLRRFTGYVEQFDTLLGVLTVAEMLLYTAELKRPMKEPLEEKRRRVDVLIEALALQSCRNTAIGGALARGISGGEAKRTNVGIALVTDPRVLFLDEPTSGLDSFTSNEVMEVVKKLTSRGITIAATIHSPTPTTFELFDRVLILQRGRVVYFGGNGEQAISYFSTNFPKIRAMRGNESVAEWIVDITTQADRDGQTLGFAEGYSNSSLRRRNERDLAQLVDRTNSVSAKTLQELTVRRSTSIPSHWAFWVLFKYRSINNYKDPIYLGSRLADKALFVFFLSTLFWRQGGNYSFDNAPNIAGFMFFWVTLPAYAAAAYVPAIVLERPVFVRERSDGLYSVATYLLHKISEEMLISTVFSLVFSLLVYFMVNLQGSFVLFWLVYLVTVSVGIVATYLIAAVSPNMDVANAALPCYITTLLFFTGFIPKWSSIPKGWIWYAYIDFLRYAWGSLMINAFEGRDVTVFSGHEILGYYSLNTESKWLFLVYEALFILAFAFAAWVALVLVRFEKR